MHTVDAYTAVRLADLAVDVSKIHNGWFDNSIENPVKIVREYRNLQKKYKLPVCNEFYLDAVEKQALAINNARKNTFKRIFSKI
jgi:hypothetical protein|tara:strand:+ start:923 stop:1174 length:252 start_codon:yes stop_codon:yes gene_type:complete